MSKAVPEHVRRAAAFAAKRLENKPSREDSLPWPERVFFVLFGAMVIMLLPAIYVGFLAAAGL